MENPIKPRKRKAKALREAGIPIREKRPGYWLVDYRRNGVTIRKGFSDLSEARTYCTIKAAELKNKGVEAASFPDRLRVDALEASAILGEVSLVDAAKFYSLHHRPQQGTRTLEALTEEYLRWKSDVKQRRKATLRSSAWRLRAFCREFGDRGAHEIGESDIEGWLDDHQWKGLNRRHYTAEIHALFSFAQRRKLIAANPAAELDKPEIPANPPEILAPDQVEDLFRAAQEKEPSLVPIFTLSFFCGIRPNEIAELDWRNIDVPSRFVRVVPSVAKMKRQRLVELSENAAAWLSVHASASGPVRDFSASTHRRRLNTVLAAAGCRLPYNAGRHAFASYHLALHAPEETAKQLGHTSTDLVFTTYRGLVSKDAALAYWALIP